MYKYNVRYIHGQRMYWYIYINSLLQIDIIVYERTFKKKGRWCRIENAITSNTRLNALFSENLVADLTKCFSDWNNHITV